MQPAASTNTLWSFVKQFFTVDIQYMPMITSILGRQVQFGTLPALPVDVLLFCTGYQFAYPFLQNIELPITSNPQRIDLYMHMFLPEYKNLAFLGTCSVEGSVVRCCYISNMYSLELQKHKRVGLLI